MRNKQTTHGYYGTPTYRSWRAMLARCCDRSHKQYKDYGGRGIAFVAEWIKFDAFLKDMGERGEGRTLDRIDVNGNYGPNNCRWATSTEQNRNKRKNLNGNNHSRRTGGIRTASAAGTTYSHNNAD